eukprot:TRINITY_DN4138_c0_g1_i2.p1 TRINITY_DN4138_c0_g1~~TRINITY_DN4138_c0_g1_i2.p1  ORF type:complete len:1064 (-),score=331.47 TRINITY_DN4138_c0_g1_i2:158-3349(-)
MESGDEADIDNSISDTERRRYKQKRSSANHPEANPGKRSKLNEKEVSETTETDGESDNSLPEDNKEEVEETSEYNKAQEDISETKEAATPVTSAKRGRGRPRKNPRKEGEEPKKKATPKKPKVPKTPKTPRTPKPPSAKKESRQAREIADLEGDILPRKEKKKPKPEILSESEDEVEYVEEPPLSVEELEQKRIEAIKSAMAFNTQILQEKKLRGGFYFDSNTRTTQVVRSRALELVISDDVVSKQSEEREHNIRRILEKSFATLSDRDLNISMIMPKAPHSGFMVYSQRARPYIKEANPSASVVDLAKACGANWKAFTPEQRKPYEDLATTEKEKYNLQITTIKNYVKEARQNALDLLPSLVIRTGDLQTALTLLPPVSNAAPKKSKAHNCGICAKRALVKEDSLCCSMCSKYYHYQCLEYKIETYRKIKLLQAGGSFHWTCNECKHCERCKSRAPDAELLSCELCTRAHHMRCLDPPLEEKPAQFVCNDCAYCESCGVGRTPQVKWSQDFRLCADCKDLKDKEEFCPVCGKVYHSSDKTPMISCDMCSAWVHTDCDGITPEQYKEFARNANKQYFCPNCRTRKKEQKREEAAIAKIMATEDNGDQSQKKRAKPPKKNTGEGEVEADVAIAENQPGEDGAAFTSPKKRGRPPKNIKPENTDESDLISPGVDTSSKKRGRPKTPRIAESPAVAMTSVTSPGEEEIITPKRKARPKKFKFDDESDEDQDLSGDVDVGGVEDERPEANSAQSQKRGRPKRGHYDESALDFVVDEVAEPTPKKKGRSKAVATEAAQPEKEVETPVEVLAETAPTPKKKGRAPTKKRKLEEDTTGENEGAVEAEEVKPAEAPASTKRLEVKIKGPLKRKAKEIAEDDEVVEEAKPTPTKIKVKGPAKGKKGKAIEAEENDESEEKVEPPKAKTPQKVQVKGPSKKGKKSKVEEEVEVEDEAPKVEAPPAKIKVKGPSKGKRARDVAEEVDETEEPPRRVKEKTPSKKKGKKSAKEEGSDEEEIVDEVEEVPVKEKKASKQKQPKNETPQKKEYPKRAKKEEPESASRGRPKKKVKYF